MTSVCRICQMKIKSIQKSEAGMGTGSAMVHGKSER